LRHGVKTIGFPFLRSTKGSDRAAWTYA
jgi:hypothetical protein